jgi:hypothetical protein
MTRQEFVDAVAEVVGLSPLREMKVETITMLADAYAATLLDKALAPGREAACGSFTPAPIAEGI